MAAPVADAAPPDPPRGWVLYDAECPLCRAGASRLASTLAARGFALAPLQADVVRCRLTLPAGEPPNETKLLAPDGRLLGGADALLAVARTIWWAWPLYALFRPRLMKPLREALYRWIAAHRHLAGGA